MIMWNVFTKYIVGRTFNHVLPDKKTKCKIKITRCIPVVSRLSKENQVTGRYHPFLKFNQTSQSSQLLHCSVVQVCYLYVLCRDRAP